MKRIKPEELTKVLTEEMIIILAKMSDEVPQSKEWHEIFDILLPCDLQRVMDKSAELQMDKEKKRQDEMTDQEKAEEVKKWERIKNDSDPHKFYGNMGQPETPDQFKNRYGIYPLGYDENGNELDETQ